MMVMQRIASTVLRVWCVMIVHRIGFMMQIGHAHGHDVLIAFFVRKHRRMDATHNKGKHQKQHCEKPPHGAWLNSGNIQRQSASHDRCKIQRGTILQNSR